MSLSIPVPSLLQPLPVDDPAPAVVTDFMDNDDDALLNALTTFYHNERIWVHRTRASLELDLAHVQGPLLSRPQHPLHNRQHGPPTSAPPTDVSDVYDFDILPVKKEEEEEEELPAVSRSMQPPPTPAPIPPLPSSSYRNPRYPPPTLNSDDSIASSSSSLYSLASSSVSTASSVPSIPTPSSFATGPLRTQRIYVGNRSVGPGLAGRPSAMPKPLPPPTRWHKRKQSFNLSLGPLASSRSLRSKQTENEEGIDSNDSGGVEPSAQLLELFGALVESRMESCERIARLVRDTGSMNLSSIGSNSLDVSPSVEIAPQQQLSVVAMEAGMSVDASMNGYTAYHNGVPAGDGINLDMNGAPVDVGLGYAINGINGPAW